MNNQPPPPDPFQSIRDTFSNVDEIIDFGWRTLDKEPTPEDMVLMAKLSDELIKFNAHFNLKFRPRNAN